jgi:methylmalonyl-CoA carboxyltransferase small subunit
VKLNITIEGKVYEVEVEVAEEAPRAMYLSGPRSGGGAAAAAPRAAAPVGGAAGRTLEDESKACRSPLSGVVSQVKVAVGDEVEADQELVILEAMKMFTSITSPEAGKIKAVEVAQGDGVKQGQLLIEFE